MKLLTPTNAVKTLLNAEIGQTFVISFSENKNDFMIVTHGNNVMHISKYIDSFFIDDVSCQSVDRVQDEIMLFLTLLINKSVKNKERREKYRH